MAAQGARALAYGLGSVLIGLTLADRGLSNAAVGVVLASLLAGSALVSVLIARHGDRVGRRRCYRLLFVGMAIAGTVFALTGWLPALIIAGLTGTVSTVSSSRDRSPRSSRRCSPTLPASTNRPVSSAPTTRSRRSPARSAP